jgi:aryl-alcohol dehydrogenase-like predicted oxidoreductase
LWAERTSHQFSTEEHEMKLRQLGTDGPSVSAVGYGAMVLSPGVYGQVDDEESLRTLQAALDAGITFLDTARLYGEGHNEELVGRAIAGRRDQVVLATKGGLTGSPPGLKVDGSPDALRADLEASLRALGTDHVDLYYLHTPDPRVPIEASVAAMADFVAEGKVRRLGVSNADLDQLRRAHATHPISASQDQYSLFYRLPEQEGRVELLRELGIALVAYSPLGNGMLAGARPGTEAGDMRSWMRRFQGAEADRVAGLGATFRGIAEREQVSPATLALAWLLAVQPHVVPIPGTRRVVNLTTNVAAADLDLTADLLDELDRSFPVEAAMQPMF